MTSAQANRGNGQTWAAGRPAAGRALGRVRTYAYDNAGNLSAYTDARGKATQMAYDAMNRRLRTSNPVGGVHKLQYDGQGLPIAETDADGRKSEAQFDAFLRLTKQTDALGHTTEYGYDLPDGTLGALYAPTETRYPTFTRQMRYDRRERPTSDTLLNPTRLGSEGLVSSTQYDARGQVKSETDANGKTRSTRYDALGQLIETTDSLGHQTQAAYDARGNLIRISDANGHATRFAYDRNDRLVKETLPLGQTTTYGYDAAGNLIQRTDPNGHKTATTHDAANRLIGVKHYDPAGTLTRSTTLTWDAADNLTAWSDSDPGHTASGSATYDDANRKTGETVTYPGGTTLSYGYATSPAGYKTRLTWPDGTEIGYAYSGHGELESVTIPGEGTISVNEFKWLAPAKTTLPGGTTQNRSYDGLLELEGIKVNSPGQQTVLSLANTWGKVQELKAQDRTDAAGGASTTRNSSYLYDDETRLTQAETQGLYGTDTETFTLDAVGNRINHSRIAGAWTYDANNRLLQKGSGADATAYDYDEAGNLTKKTEPGNKVTRYAYDSQNRLAEVRDGQGNPIARYGYDPLDRRLWKEQYRDRNGNALSQAQRTLYLYADEGLIAEATQAITLNADQSVTANGSPVITTQYGPRPDAEFGTGMLFVKTKNSNGQDTFAYYHPDQLGTPIQATDKQGNLVWAASYNAFGQASITTPDATADKPTITSNLRLPGQYWDAETGLHYNFRRYYDPGTGRYVTQDPIGLEGGINFYSYVNGNPLTYMDPYGLFGWADMPAAPDWLVNGAAGFGDTLSFGGTNVLRNWMDLNGSVNRCSSAYSNGQWGAVGVSLAFGGAHLGRNALYQMGKGGLGRGLSRLLSDGRTWGRVRDTWSVAAGNGERWLAANGQSLHHWLIPQRFAEVNAGFNYMPISAGFNSWMNGSTAFRTAVEWGFRGSVAGIYGVPITAAVSGDDCTCQK